MPTGIYTARVDLMAMRTALRAERLKRRMSLDDLAKKSGVNRTTIQDVETNRDGKPQLATVARLVEGMGLTLSDFFARIEGLNVPARPGENVSSSSHATHAEGTRGSGPVPGGGDRVPSNEFIHEAIIIGIAEQLAEHFDRAIAKLADAHARRQAPTPRAHTPVRDAHRRKSG